MQYFIGFQIDNIIGDRFLLVVNLGPSQANYNALMLCD